MEYQIEYAYTSHMGKLRENNEDNFWCCGDSLRADNKGLEEVRGGTILQTEKPLLAVFDGMGGESCGEIAAFLAADACGRHYRQYSVETAPGKVEDFLVESCRNMNQAVCAYAAENRIGSMGTTVAMMGFDRDAIVACNLGDSRIYQSYPGSFLQISTDHVMKNITFGKAPLTQYIGIPEGTITLEPSVIRVDAFCGVRYLLCSDGVTDMLTDKEIREILDDEESDVKEAVERLLARALEKGGRDNVTIILCEIQEQSIKTRMRQWMKRQKEKRRK